MCSTSWCNQDPETWWWLAVLGGFHHMCDQFLIFWITVSKGTSWSQSWYGTLQFESTWDFLPQCEERLYQIEPQALIKFLLYVFFWMGHSIVMWLPMADRGQVVFSFYYWHPTLTQSVERRIEFAEIWSCLHVCPKPLWLSLMQDLITPLLPAIQMMWSLPAVVTYEKDPETVSFTNIQLSTQGAERQRKDVRDLAVESAE